MSNLESHSAWAGRAEVARFPCEAVLVPFCFRSCHSSCGERGAAEREGSWWFVSDGFSSYSHFSWDLSLAKHTDTWRNYLLWFSFESASFRS